jgi:hypothetical protein
MATTSHGVNGLNFHAEHRSDVFGLEQVRFLLLSHGATIKERLLLCRVNWVKRREDVTMPAVQWMLSV